MTSVVMAEENLAVEKTKLAICHCPSGQYFEWAENSLPIRPSRRASTAAAGTV